MSLEKCIKAAVYEYCNNHLADENWYNKEFEFTQIRFDAKCRTAEKLGLLHCFINNDGTEIDLASEIIEIYGYRNAIHLIAEQRKGIEYELELSKRAYRRMRPFIDQIKEKLKADKKGIYANL